MLDKTANEIATDVRNTNMVHTAGIWPSIEPAVR